MKQVYPHHNRLAWIILLASFSWSSLALAAPCVLAEIACTELINVSVQPTGVLAYRTHPLDVMNETVTRAVIVVHGADRSAAGSFSTMLAAAFLAGVLEDTLVVSPRFASSDGDCRDTLGPNELTWRCEVPGDWRTGGSAINDDSTTPYDVLDTILGKISAREIFPNLRGIVVAGHSAGGQLLTHYQMTNQVHEQLGVPVTYVVANSSLYSYLDNLRPLQNLAPAIDTPAQAAVGPEDASISFAPFADAGNCPTYQQWPFGLTGRTDYAAETSGELLKKQLASRPTTYLLGGRDTLPLAGFFASCSAIAQGPTRLDRGLAFAKYVREHYGAQHKTIVIPDCGHSSRCVFTADAALPALFPRP